VFLQNSATPGTHCAQVMVFVCGLILGIADYESGFGLGPISDSIQIWRGMIPMRWVVARARRRRQDVATT
jgi:hypothetical protein